MTVAGLVLPVPAALGDHPVMTPATPPTTSAPVGATDDRRAVRLAFTASSAVLVLLILVQAVLAGQSLFNSVDIAIHGYVGNASFTVGLLVAVLAAVARVPRWQLVLAAVVLAVLFAQTGLGYVGRESTAAASWHVPLGVTVFGLATVQLVAGAPMGRSRSLVASA